MPLFSRYIVIYRARNRLEKFWGFEKRTSLLRSRFWCRDDTENGCVGDQKRTGQDTCLNVDVNVICLPTRHLGALKTSFESVRALERKLLEHP